eukprot:CAMPEP_0174274778 /NCGR_PEP_ID=MMETSP0439-20130205/59216_1 /TAXON_ID=0 /ORGANISM="Stereomyxa ramosa, Strain Chinc5" /LENGTH=340 /DNA_ID=CAMNT_0015366777 /DNA_START=97 /DNA_END=1116 /DNA_ORIENTATION=-
MKYLTVTHSNIEKDLRPWVPSGIDYELIDPQQERNKEFQGVYIIDNELYYTKDTIRKKYGRLHRCLQSYLQYFKSPDLFFLLNVMPKAREHILTTQSRGENLRPLFSLSKTDEYADVLYPNMYFGHIREWKLISTMLLNSNNKHPWDSKISKAFWRGSCGQNKTATQPRLDLLKLHEHDDVLDVSTFFPCPLRQYKKQAESLSKEIDTYKKFPVGDMIDQVDFARYKYLLNMPGDSEGGYSKNLQTILPLNSTSLFWKSDWREFYYYHLQPNVHYIEVDETNVVSVVTDLQKNDEKAKKIAEDSTQFFVEHLSPVDIVNYWKELLTAYSQLLNFDPRDQW